MAGVAPRGKLTMEHGSVLHEEMTTIPSILAFDPALPTALKNLAGA